MVPTIDDKLLARISNIRRTLHQFPELAYNEQQTSTLIVQELDLLGIPFRKGLAGTGIRAEITGKTISKQKKTPCVALRADMDALPIVEFTGLSFASRNKGVMHACGHDGHVAMLLGTAAMLKNMDMPGRVVLLFQPAEESGNGAAKMVEDNALDGVDMILMRVCSGMVRPGLLRWR